MKRTPSPKELDQYDSVHRNDLHCAEFHRILRLRPQYVPSKATNLPPNELKVLGMLRTARISEWCSIHLDLQIAYREPPVA